MSFGLKLNNRVFTESNNYSINKITANNKVVSNYLYSNDNLTYFKDRNIFANNHSYFEIIDRPSVNESYGVKIGNELIKSSLRFKSRQYLSTQGKRIYCNRHTDLIFLKSNDLRSFSDNNDNLDFYRWISDNEVYFNIESVGGRS